MKNVTDNWNWRNFKRNVKRTGDGCLTGILSYIETLEQQILDLDRRLNAIMRKEEEKEDDLH